MTTPEFFTRADIPGVAEAMGEAVAESGGGFSLETIEGLFKFAERAERLIEKAGASLMRMQEFHANGNRSNVVSADPIDEGRVMQTEPVEQSKVWAQPSQITAEKVYMKTLAALNELRKRDPDMKISDILIQARTFKLVVLDEIEKALLDMAASDPE